jgi:hypothetical protein
VYIYKTQMYIYKKSCKQSTIEKEINQSFKELEKWCNKCRMQMAAPTLYIKASDVQKKIKLTLSITYRYINSFKLLF